MTALDSQLSTPNSRAPREPASTFQEFLPRLDIPPRDGRVAPRLSGDLPCHCRPSRSALKSGRRGLTVTADGTVFHTRCGQVIARYNGTEFILEVYPEPVRQPISTAPTITADSTEPPPRPRRSVLDDTGRDTGTTPGCSLD